MDIYIARGQEQLGPYPLDQVQQLLDSGVLKPDDFAFHEGLDNWTPLPEVIAAQASDLPPLPAMPAPAAPEPASPAEPIAQPTAATAPDKPKKGVPIWLRILAWILVLGLILAVTIGVSVWYWYKPDPLEDEPLLEEMGPGPPGMPQGPGPTSGNQNNNPSRETTNTTQPTEPNEPDNDSLAELEQAAENGFTLAQAQLGLMHLTSQDPQKKDPALAIKWLERAAKQGHSAAQANAAQYYFSQNNPQRDLSKAAYWASLAARANGRQQTQYKELLAKILGAATPDQVKKSRALASNFTPIKELTNAKLKDLANQGNPRAQQTLGYRYVGGRDGINKDTNEAVRWWTRAARQGWPISQNNLGNVFSRGKIRPKDLVQAYMWASLADQNGVPTARQTLNQIQREITPDQVKEATLLVENFKPLAEKSLIGDPGKLTPAQVENILAQEIGSWKVKGTTVTLDPKTGTGEAKEFEDKLETRWKEKGKSTISSFGSGMGQNLTGTTVYDSEMEWFIWRVQGEGRRETVSKNIYDPATKTYHQLLMLPNDHVERGTFKRINKDEAILKSEIFNADNEVVATQEINFTRIDSDDTEPTEPTKKLTANEASEVMAWEIGSWEAKGQGQPAGGQPNPIAITREVRWKEEGKSLKYKFSLIENGKPVTYFGHQEYDAAMGVFVYRSKWGNNPETTSHEVYDVTTRTTQGRAMPAPSEGEPSTTTITKRVGDDRSEQTLKITQNGQVIYSHKIVSTRIKTAPIEKKLSSAEVEKILAAQIGQWQIRGQLTPANEEPIAYEFTLNVQWQEKGKSISSTGTLEKAGEKISLFSSKEYDPSKGVFAFRFRQGLRPEVLSHEQYDPVTQTFQGRQISPEEPEVTYTFQADGPDKFIFKSKTTRNGQLISTDESIQIRAPKPEK